MRFTVIGTDAAGILLEIAIDARSADEAEHVARQRGVNVAKVSLGVQAGAVAPDSAPSATAPTAVHKPTSSTTNTSPTAKPVAPVSAKSPSSKGRMDLGLVSLALGGTALMFCWIPVVGLVSWPLGAAGALCGAGCLLGASNRGPRPRSMAKRLAAPLGGIALSALTLLAAGVLAAAAPEERSSAFARSTPDSVTHPAPVVSQSTTADQKPRTLSIVAAAPAPDGFASSATAATTPTLPPASPTLKLGDAELRVLSADVMQAPLIGDQGRPEGLSAKPLMVLRIEVRNTGTSPIEYRTISGGADKGIQMGAILKDDRGRTLSRAVFAHSIVPLGRVAEEALEPGRVLTDVLVFERPTASSAHFTLTVPGEAVGASGSGELGVPAPTVR